MSKFTKVFSFTFQRQTGTKGWRTATVLMALLLFLLPALLPTLIDQIGGEPAPDPALTTAQKFSSRRIPLTCGN